jgi:VCBS repeat-containing protein
VLGNDSDANGDKLTARLVSKPAHGTLILKLDGGFVYTPAAGFVGTDTFTYQANDGAANSNVATVTFTIS